MKSNIFFYVLLAVVGLLDAWLLAHPNLLGKLGILFYNYDMIRTLPRALVTVAVTLLVCAGVAWVLLKRPKSVSVTGLSISVLATLGLTIHTFFKFSSGSYAYTGSGFKTGAMLLPILMTLVFGEALYRALRR